VQLLGYTCSVLESLDSLWPLLSHDTAVRQVQHSTKCLHYIFVQYPPYTSDNARLSVVVVPRQCQPAPERLNAQPAVYRSDYHRPSTYTFPDIRLPVHSAHHANKAHRHFPTCAKPSLNSASVWLHQRTVCWGAGCIASSYARAVVMLPVSASALRV
jgi:hypothetical protein